MSAYNNANIEIMTYNGQDVLTWIHNGVIVFTGSKISESDLVDFNYTANDNGTYTITGWKGTTNGVPSTELILPDSNRIIL